MGYPLRIRKFLNSKKISVGDKILIKTKDGEKIKGILLPRIEIGDKNSLVLKLSNGYNLGIEFKKILKIKKIKKAWRLKEKKQKKETTIFFRKSLPTISLLSTGGTIASRVDYRTGGVHASFDAKDIVEQVNDLGEIANVHAREIMKKMSEDMKPSDWIKIAREVYKQIKKGSKGIIVTHGTDTMHYTSAILSFMLRDLNVPVALVGSQRSSDRGSSDTVMNLSCAANFVANSNIAEVVIVMHASINDDFCYAIRGTKVRKMHTSRRDAFRPINDMPLAKVYWKTKKIEYLNTDYNRRNNKKPKLDTKIEPRVALIKIYPGMDPEIFDFYIRKKYKGFVLEATGLGHVPTSGKNSILSKIEKSINKNIPVVITSQCIYGKTHPTIYHNLRELYKRGAIFVEDMLPEVAYVKLMWVLGHTKKIEKVREMMTKNIAGEISKSLKVETFLF